LINLIAENLAKGGELSLITIRALKILNKSKTTKQVPDKAE
jgi:hypothetical protein